ncbi:MAG TPA: DNA polymerase Y family protein, partial [Gammaproteobacteria bacterium]|nr:DNA polymerase Y family protein [Gammaproteobacteria bacterium]
FPLTAPAEGLSLIAEAPFPLEEVQTDLFEPGASREGDWQALIERLQARLGPDAVHGCLAVPDHRPERAWRTAAPGENGDPPRFGPRPLWLLEPPRPLTAARGRPEHDGPLRLVNGPERIEAAWWEADGVARDYYVAEDRSRARLWIFRERRPPGRWFLHGLFA